MLAGEIDENIQFWCCLQARSVQAAVRAAPQSTVLGDRLLRPALLIPCHKDCYEFEPPRERREQKVSYAIFLELLKPKEVKSPEITSTICKIIRFELTTAFLRRLLSYDAFFRRRRGKRISFLTSLPGGDC